MIALFIDYWRRHGHGAMLKKGQCIMCAGMCPLHLQGADAYQPTRDLHQTQRRYLTSVANTLFTQLGAVQQQAGHWGTDGEAGQGTVAVEVGMASALGAMLDLEHR
jgi:hypothetical protein